MTAKNRQEPFIKKFKVGKHHYLYDVNSNEILRVDRIYYDLCAETGNNNTKEIVAKYEMFYPPRGSCFPGTRRLLVDVTGRFFMCEKVGSNYPIGDVEKGFYYGEILNFYESYDRFFQECADCWALRLCTKCFNSIRKGAEFDLERKKMFCRKQIKRIEENLISYCKILEQNPSAFKFYENAKVT